MTRARLGWAAALAALVAGCAPKEARPALDPASPVRSSAGPLKEVDAPKAPRVDSGQLTALERDLDIAEQRMDEQLARRDAPAVDAPPQPGDERERADVARAPRPSRARAPGESGPAGQPLGASGSRCDIACRAFHSMRRAADGLCELGEVERCAAARGRVERAARRIADAGCRCIEG